MKNDRSQDVLILVHPDSIIERGPIPTIEYLSRLESIIPQYAAVFTHFFHSPDIEDHSLWYFRTYESKLRLLKEIQAVCNEYGIGLWDHPRFQASFKKHLPDWLIEHSGVTIRIAGGYIEDWGCVFATRQKLFDMLGWLIDEGEHSVIIDDELCFRSR